MADSTLTWMPSVNRRNVLKQRLLSGQTHLWIIEQYSCRRVSNLSPAWPLLLEGVNNFLSEEIKNTYTQHTRTHILFLLQKKSSESSNTCTWPFEIICVLSLWVSESDATWTLSVPLHSALPHSPLGPQAPGSVHGPERLFLCGGPGRRSPCISHCTGGHALPTPEAARRVWGARPWKSNQQRSQHWLVRSPGPGGGQWLAGTHPLQAGMPTRERLGSVETNAIADLLSTIVPLTHAGYISRPQQKPKTQQSCTPYTVFSPTFNS